MTASAKRRVVVTGMGLLTPLGIGLDEPWNALISGRSGIGPITQFDAAGLKTPIAGEVKDFDPRRYFSHVEVHKMDAFIQYAVVGGMLAMELAGWYRDGKPSVPFERERFGCFLGVGMGGVPRIEGTLASTPLVNGIPPSFIPAVIPNLAAGQLCVRFGLKGPGPARTGSLPLADFVLAPYGRLGGNAWLSPRLGSGSTALPPSQSTRDAVSAARGTLRGRQSAVGGPVRENPRPLAGLHRQRRRWLPRLRVAGLWLRKASLRRLPPRAVAPVLLPSKKHLSLL